MKHVANTAAPRRWGLIDQNQMRRRIEAFEEQAESILNEVGDALDPNGVAKLRRKMKEMRARFLGDPEAES